MGNIQFEEEQITTYAQTSHYDRKSGWMTQLILNNTEMSEEQVRKVLVWTAVIVFALAIGVTVYGTRDRTSTVDIPAEFHPDNI